MITGEFIQGRPTIKGRLVFPRLGIKANFTFLVDTGAGCTCIMPAEVALWKIPVNKLKDTMLVSGLDGKEKEIYSEQCVLMFPQGNKSICIYIVDVGVYTGDEEENDSPSLLGQDVLRRWRMRHDPPTGRLEFTATSYDYMFRGSLDSVPTDFGLDR